MEDHRSEEEDAGDDSEGPVLRRGPAGVLRSELGSQGERNQKKNDEPAGVQVNRDAENAPEQQACRRGCGSRGARLWIWR
jgi:hypothetical protein